MTRYRIGTHVSPRLRYFRPGYAERALLVAAVLVPGMVERLAKNVLRVRRQVIRYRRREFVV
jgi:hypothetical protein